MTAIIDAVVHVAVLVALPPLLAGVIGKVKASFAGRTGPPVLQGYYDIAKLVRRGTVLSRTTTWVFLAGPAVTLSAAFLAGLMVPLAGAPAPVRFAGDIVLFAGLLALGRLFTILAALDTGSSFEGMGASREAAFACFAEPALFLAVLALSRLTGGLSMSELLGAEVARGWLEAAPTMVLLLAGLFIVLLAENARIPFDDPSTHLELTMVHEAMVLDHGGPGLGAAQAGASVRLMVLCAIVARLMAPAWPEHLLLRWGAAVGSILLVAAAVGVIESVMARLRLSHVPNLLVGACLLTGFGFILLPGGPA
jgi:formate hydrogenlyase subunit 4